MGRKKSEKAIFGRIAERAPDAGPDELKILAEAHSAVVFGPEGGNWRNSSDTRYRSDQHVVNHQGEKSARRSTGFE